MVWIKNEIVFRDNILRHAVLNNCINPLFGYLYIFLAFKKTLKYNYNKYYDTIKWKKPQYFGKLPTN